MYELQQLIETFRKNSIECEKRDLEFTQKFIKECPGEPLPDYLLERMNGSPFDINLALESMCKEIDKLWIAIGGPQ